MFTIDDKKLVYNLMLEIDNLNHDSLTAIAETLSNIDLEYDYDELETIFNQYLEDITLGNDPFENISESKRSKDKSVHINKNAGNVEFNVSAFNHAMGADSAGGESGGGFCGCAENLDPVDCIYQNLNESVLTEAGYNLKAVNSKQNILSKIFSKQMKPYLLDDNFNPVRVENKGSTYDKDHGNINAEAENESNPKPGFSIVGNIGGSGNGDLYRTTVSHHVFGVTTKGNGILSKCTVEIPGPLHTHIHNEINKTYLNIFTDGAEVPEEFANAKASKATIDAIDNIYEKYVRNSHNIRRKDSCIYGGRSGLLLREYEYCLRAIAAVIKESKLWLTVTAYHTAKAITGQNVVPMLDMNDTNYLKIHTAKGDLEVLPIISIISGSGKTINDLLSAKIFDTDGNYLIDIKPEVESCYMKVIIFEDGKGKEINIEDLRHMIVTKADKPDKKKPANESLILTEDTKDLVEISLADMRNILISNYRIASAKWLTDAQRKTGTQGNVFENIYNILDKGKGSYSSSDYCLTSAELAIKPNLRNWFELHLAEAVKVFVDSNVDFKVYTDKDGYIKPSKKEPLFKSKNDEKESDIPTFSPRDTNIYRFKPTSIIVIKNNVEYFLNGAKQLSVSLPFETILKKIIDNQIIDKNLHCPAFLDINGQILKGIGITASAPYSILAFDDFDYSTLEIIDLTKMPLTILKSMNNYGMKGGAWDAIHKLLCRNDVEVEKLIWSRLLGTRVYNNIFSSCHINHIENLFDKVSSIGQGAFAYSWIKEAIMPQVYSISSGAFEGCHGLEKLFIGDAINTLDKGMISDSRNCDVLFALSEKEFKGKQGSWGGISSSWGKSGVHSVTFDADVNTFYGYSKLTESLNESVSRDVSAKIINNWSIMKVSDYRANAHTNNKILSAELAGFLGRHSYSTAITMEYKNADEHMLYIFDSYLYQFDVKNNVIMDSRITPVAFFNENLDLKECLIFDVVYWNNLYEQLQADNIDTLTEAKKQTYDFDLKTILNSYSSGNSYSGADLRLNQFMMNLIAADARKLVYDPNLLISISKDKVKEALVNFKLSSSVAKPLLTALEEKGLSAEDYYDKLINDTDTVFTNAAFNAYYKAALTQLVSSYRKDVVKMFKENYNVDVDFEHKLLKFPYSYIIDEYIARNDGIDVIENLTPFLPDVYKNLLAIYHQKVDVKSWLSGFVKNFIENLKNYKN